MQNPQFETITIDAIEGGVPDLVEARAIIAGFHTMIRLKTAPELPSWLQRASGSLVASFGCGGRKDEAAVRIAATSQWSNDQTEGQINRLKFIKRQMYGRAKIDLLQARMMGAT